MADEGMEPLADRIFEEVQAELASKQDTPLSTYRVQVHRELTLRDVTAQVPYLSRLGITHLYTSPLLRAQPGSTHGYDVVDHGQLNPEVGTEEDLAALAGALRAHGMGLVLDIVPNHMGIEKGRNPTWNDVLENGPAAIHARYFDVDWDPVKEELKGKVLLPILGDQYGVVLERGELALTYHDGAFDIRYFDHTFPVAPRAYALVLRHRLAELEAQVGSEDLDLQELLSILTAIDHLPAPGVTDRARILERNREKEVIKRRLGNLHAHSAPVRRFIDDNVRAFNGTPDDRHSFDLLDRVLSSCNYRLAHWRVAGEEINYRRFFDINGLAAIRVEDREVFDAAHRLAFRWLDEGKIHGLRIDHPDGLFDPTAYFLRLQEEYFIQRARARRPATAKGSEEADAAWRDVESRLRARFHQRFLHAPDDPIFRGLYVLVEKIQGGKERIPDAWAVHGTTGYRFANVVTGLFVPREQEKAFTRIWERFLGEPTDLHPLVYEKKKLIMSVSMASEINVLARELNRISEMDRRTRDFTIGSLRRALVEFIALFPVYRTYVDDWRALDVRDVEYVRWTIARARQKDPTTNATIFDFLQDVLLQNHTDLPQAHRDAMLRFTMKLQQVTGPVMAKGLEDTVFYIYNRLAALNEVGGEPERFGASVETFHLRNQERAEKWPAAMLASSTHDTKRSEDVRARLTVLAEVPEEWKEHLRRWGRQNRRFRQTAGARQVPDPNEEYLYYQTLLGAWPMGDRPRGEAFEVFRRRVRDYMRKAVREAKVNTSWVNPDAEWEAALDRFVDRTLSEKNTPFLESVEAFKRRLERPGIFNGLSALLLKLASPGTPDTYQGCELWDLSLVDPDNRRPVDFEARARTLDELMREASQDRGALCRRLLQTVQDGRVKQYVLAQGLRVRNRHPALFRRGDYLPLDVVGPAAPHAVAFARRHGEEWMVAVAPRLLVPLLDADGGPAKAVAGTVVRLPRALATTPLTCAFTGRTFVAADAEGGPELDLGELLSDFPVVLLENVPV
jgi:(1->4)-alpha-D-glucan 1-alpha-D-glucosylmutase